MAFESLTERLQNVFKIYVKRKKSLNLMSKRQPKKFVWPCFEADVALACCKGLYQEGS